MASVRKLGSGNYQVRFRDQTGRERSRTFGRKVHADRFRHDLEYELDRGDWVDPRSGQITLADWVEHAWKLRPTVKARTASDRQARMIRHVLPAFGHSPLSCIERERVQLWVNELSDSGYAPATVKKVFETLSATLRTAVDYERLARSPCDRISLPPLPYIDMRFLVPEEVDSLAVSITPYFEILIRFAAETGLRISEIAGLQGRDYRSADQTVSVKRQLLKDTAPATYGDPKSAAGIRSLTLSPTLATRIESLKVLGDAPLFPSTRGNLFNQSNFRRRHFVPAVERAGIGYLRIHDLRHTAISLWINKGATIKQVTTRAGISSVATAFDRYGHIFPNEDRDLADRLDRPEATSSGAGS